MKKQFFSFNHKFNNNPRKPRLNCRGSFLCPFCARKNLKNFWKAIDFVALKGYNKVARKGNTLNRNKRKKEKKMTRKELISYCVDAQIAHNVVKAENRNMYINAYLFGYYGVKKMSKADCEKWYKEIKIEENWNA